MTNKEEDAEFLAHYGRVGMKWGIRKNPSRAFARSAKKADSLDRRSVKLELKGAKITRRGQRRMARSTRWYSLNKSRNLIMGLRIQARGSAKALRSVKLSRKSLKWKADMLEQFKDVKASDISAESKALGKAYVGYLLND